MRAFPDAVSAYKSGDLTAADLYRTIMAWPKWLVAGHANDAGAGRGTAESAGADTRDATAAFAIAVLRDPSGAAAMELFSDQAARHAFMEREDQHLPTEVVGLPGYQLFLNPQVAALARVNLDMHSPHATHFYGRQIPLLQAWAAVTQVELALTVPERFDDPVSVIRSFDEYRVLVHRSGGEQGLVMAPDSRGRSLVAIFTADDVIEEFIAAIEADLPGELAIEHRTGRELFAELAPLDLDGVVFNPLTHLPPTALRAEILRVLADAPPPHYH